MDRQIMFTKRQLLFVFYKRNLKIACKQDVYLKHKYPHQYVSLPYSGLRLGFCSLSWFYLCLFVSG